MAVVQVEFRANANFGDLIAQVNAANMAVRNLNENFSALQKNKVDGIVKEFNRALTASGQYTAQTVQLTSQAEAFGKALDRQKLSLRQYYNEYQNYHRNQKSMIKDLAAQQTMLERSMVVSRGRDASGRTLADVITPTGLDGSIATKAMQSRKELQILNKVLNDGATSLINWGKNTQWAGRQLTVGLTVPLTILGSSAAKMALDVDRQLTNVVKVYGNSINSMMTLPQVNQLKAQLMDLSKTLAQTYGQAATDTLDLAQQLAAAGKTGADLTASITQTTKLATLGEVDRAEAMKATLAIQTAFKQSNSELADSINFLNAVENQTSTSLQDLVTAIPKAGPVVRGLGGDIKDLALMMVSMKEGGVPAAEAANAIKSGLSSLINPTVAARKELKQFGVDIDQIQKDANGKMLPMIMGFKKAIDGLDQFSRTQVLEKTFGKMQFARMAAMFNNIGEAGSQTNEVIKLMGASTEQLGAIADQELKQLQQSVSGQFNRALETTKLNLAEIGQQFLVIGTKGLQAVNWLVDKFQSLPDVVKKAFGGLGLGVAIIGPIIMMTGVIGNFLGYLVKGVAMFKSFGNAGTREYEHLTVESTAAKLAGDLLSQSMYDQTKAASVLEAEIQKLINSLNGVEGASTIAMAGLSESMTTAVAETAAAAKAAQEKSALAAGATAPIVGTRNVGKTPWSGAEFSHFAPSAGREDVFGVAPSALVGSASAVAKGSAASLFQQAMNQNFIASPMFTESMAGLNEARMAYLRQMAAGNTEAEAVLKSMTAEDAAALLPTIESIKGVNVQYASFWNAIGRGMAGGSEQMQQEARAIQARYSQALKDNKTKEEAMLIAFQEMQQAAATGTSEIGRHFQTTVTELNAAIDGIIASEKTLEEKAIEIRTAIDRIEAEGLSTRPRGFGVRTGYQAGNPEAPDRRSGDNRALAVALQDQYNQEHRARMAVIAVEEKAATEQVKAAATQERAAVTQTEAAVKQDAAAAKQEVAAMESGAAGTGGLMGKLKGFAGSRAGKFAGMAAGVGMLAGGLGGGGDSAAGQAVGIAGGAASGAMMGAMAGPWGAAIGGIIGGAIPLITTLTGNIAKAEEQMRSLSEVGEIALDKLGGNFQSLADASITSVITKTQEAQTEVQKLTDAFKNAAEGSKDNNFMKLLQGEGDKSSIAGFVGDKITELIGAGMKPEDIKAYIAAALQASGHGDMVQEMADGVGKAVVQNFGTSLAAQIMDSKLSPEELQKLQAQAQVRVGGSVGSAGGAVNPAGMQYNAIARSADAQAFTTQLGDFANNAGKAGAEGIKAMTDQLNILRGVMPPIGIITQNISDNFKGFAKNVQESGGTTEQVLQLIALNAAGVQEDMTALSKDPYRITVLYQEFVQNEQQKSTLQGGIDAMLQQRAKDLMTKNPVVQAADPKKVAAANKASEDAQRARIDAVGKYYDKLIAKEKAKEAALQKLQDAEKRRLEREKQMRDSQVSYNEAIASGNFGQAALIKNNMDAQKLAWAQEDKQRAQDDAAQTRLQKLEDAKAKAQAAEQARLDRLQKSHQNVAAASLAAASAAKKVADSQAQNIASAQKIIDDTFKANPGKFVDAMKQLSSPENTAKINGLLKGTGITMAQIMQTTLHDKMPGLSTDMVNAIGKNLATAPWDQIGVMITAALAPRGQATFARAVKAIETWAANPTSSGGTSGRPSVYHPPGGGTALYSQGGHVTGPGGPETDSIPAMLSNGEYVISNKAVGWFGKSNLDKINKRQGFAQGGLVEPTAADAARTVMAIAMNQAMLMGRPGSGVIGTGAANVDAGATKVGSSASPKVVGTGLGASIAQYAMRFLGVPYSHTAMSPTEGWGCAPFMHWVYAQKGFNIPGGTVSNAQYNGIRNHPDRGHISAGDLLFFKYANGVNLQNPINHVGMYIGGGNMVHAANPKRGTIASGVDWGNYVGAARPVNYDTGVPNYRKGGIVGSIKEHEFMINDRATRHYGTDLLNSINNQTYHNGGLVTANGPRREGSVASGGNSEYHFTIYGGENDPQQIADEVMKRIESKQKRVTRGR